MTLIKRIATDSYLINPSHLCHPCAMFSFLIPKNKFKQLH